MSYNSVYDLLIEKAQDSEVKNILLGRVWALCESENSAGLAMCLDKPERSLPWPGSLRGQSMNKLAKWLSSWNPIEATVALSAINASINAEADIMSRAVPVRTTTNNNLSVFEHFFPQLIGKNVVVIGRYPGLEQYQKELNLTVLEQNPGNGDMPAAASEFVIAEADWVFLTATSIINKTFPRICELAKDSNLVLMGPSVPWVPELSEYGIDFIAGVEIMDRNLLRQVVSEGGGVNIFNDAVRYKIYDLGKAEMDWCHLAISDLVSRREDIKTEMERWFNGADSGRFPKQLELLKIDKALSQFDSQYKRLWDARYTPMNSRLKGFNTNFSGNDDARY